MTKNQEMKEAFSSLVWTQVIAFFFFSGLAYFGEYFLSS